MDAFKKYCCCCFFTAPPKEKIKESFISPKKKQLTDFFSIHSFGGNCDRENSYPAGYGRCIVKRGATGNTNNEVEKCLNSRKSSIITKKRKRTQ